MSRDDGSIGFQDVVKFIGLVSALSSAAYFSRQSKKLDEEMRKQYLINPSHFAKSPQQVAEEIRENENFIIQILWSLFGGISPGWAAMIVSIVFFFLWIISAGLVVAFYFSINPEANMESVGMFFGLLDLIAPVVCFIYINGKFKHYRNEILGVIPAGTEDTFERDAMEEMTKSAEEWTGLEEYDPEKELMIGKKTVIPLSVRTTHMYLIGAAGMGKSSAAELLFLQDYITGRGCALMDPHGDLFRNCFNKIAAGLYLKDKEVNQRKSLTNEEIENRIKDLPILKRLKIIDLTDTKNAVGFNPLEKIEGVDSYQQAVQLQDTFKKMWKFDENEAPTMSQLLRNTAYVLIENNQTLLEATLLLTNPLYRKQMLKNITHPGIKLFWTERFEKWILERQTSKIDSTYNKIEAFTSDPLVRPIIGQKRSTIKFRESMDKGDILLFNLPKGKMGSSANLLGAFFIANMHLAAMSRENIPEKSRRPFYVFVDEFQNFASANFNEILAEDRKYGLHYILINQYLGALDEDVLEALFGNVNTIVAFKVGNREDALLVGSKFYNLTGTMIKTIHKEQGSIPGTMIPYTKKRADYFNVSDEEKIRAENFKKLLPRMFMLNYVGLPEPQIDVTMTINHPDPEEEPIRSYISKVKEIVNTRCTRPRKEVENEIEKRSNILAEHNRPFE